MSEREDPARAAYAGRMLLATLLSAGALLAYETHNLSHCLGQRSANSSGSDFPRYSGGPGGQRPEDGAGRSRAAESEACHQGDRNIRGGMATL